MSENNKEKKKKNKNRGVEFFGRLMAGILAIMMILGVAATLIFNLIR